MGFLQRLFGKIEKVNKGELSADALDQPFEVDLAREADDYWFQMEQNLIVNVVKAAGGPEAVERGFLLVNFKEDQERFEIFYQVKGRLKSWRELDLDVVSKLEQQLMPQAKEVTVAVNKNFREAGVRHLVYAMLQFESQTMAWFGRKLTSDSPEAQVSFEELVQGWKLVLASAIDKQPLDSDRPLPYFEVK